MRWLMLFSLAGCVRSCDNPADSALLDSAPSTSADAVRVVVLVLDGVRIEESLGDGYSDVLDAETTSLYPKLRENLFPIGAVMDNAIVPGMTRTAPAHADLLAGRRTPFANYPNDTDSPGAYLPELPTLIDAIAPAPALVVTNSPLVGPVHRSVSPQGGAAADLRLVQGDDTVLDTLRAQLPDSAYRLVVVNLHKADALAHALQLDGYIERSQAYDGLVYSFWRWLQDQPGWQEQTVLAVVADHGRHRLGTDDDWVDHGDHCVGCRQVPMLLVGPGVQAGARVSEVATLEDLGATLAQLLGVSLPYAAGAPIAGALEAQPAPTVDGAVRLDVAGGVVVTEDTTAGRSAVSLDGAIVSSPDAFTAEAPRVAVAGTTTYACWRELDLTDADEEGTWPWRPRCSAGDTAIDPDVAPVWSEWRPALAADDGGLWMAWIDNLTGIAMTGSPVRLSRWTGADGWDHSVSLSGGAFPDGITLRHDGDAAWIAFAESDADAEGRLGRRIALYRVFDGTPWRRLRVRPDALEAPEDVAGEGDRLEHPALWVGGETIRLAWVSYQAGPDSVGAALWQIESTDQGNNWSTPSAVASSVLGHVAPVWTASGELAWVTAAGAVCVGDGASCTDLGTEVVMDLAADGEALQVTAARDGAWERISL